MYNKQLDTFLLVVEKKSFSKAAEALYLTPSAVIQQINNLEKDLKVRLFRRTRHGISLTEAGEVLAAEAGPYILKGRSIRRQLLAVSMQKNCLCVGTSAQQKARLLYNIWMRFCASRRDYRINMVNIEGAADQMDDAELIESLFDYSPWQKDWQFLKLCDVPIGCALPRDHALASYERIRYEDLKTNTLVLMNRNLSDIHRDLYLDIIAHKGTVIEVSHYDAPLIWECSSSQYLLQAPLCWQDILPELAFLPCEWEFFLPYGFFYRKNCSAPVREFIDFTRSLCQEKPEEYRRMIPFRTA